MLMSMRVECDTPVNHHPRVFLLLVVVLLLDAAGTHDVCDGGSTMGDDGATPA